MQNNRQEQLRETVVEHKAEEPIGLEAENRNAKCNENATAQPAETRDVTLNANAEKGYQKENEITAKVRKFTCKYCRYRSSFRHGLQQHLKSVHNKANHFECPVCDYWTNRRIDLNRHKRVKHESLRSCRYCDYDATSQEVLVQHIIENASTHVASNNVW